MRSAPWPGPGICRLRCILTGRWNTKATEDGYSITFDEVSLLIIGGNDPSPVNHYPAPTPVTMPASDRLEDLAPTPGVDLRTLNLLVNPHRNSLEKCFSPRSCIDWTPPSNMVEMKSLSIAKISFPNHYLATMQTAPLVACSSLNNTLLAWCRNMGPLDKEFPVNAPTASRKLLGTESTKHPSPHS